MCSLSVETKPQLFRSGKLVTGVSVADPAFTIVEVVDAMGFLLSESCYESEMETELHLENVLWVRHEKGASSEQGSPKEGKVTSRSLAEVCVYRHEMGLFVAQDATSLDYLPYPSVGPYQVLFLRRGQYVGMLANIKQKLVAKLLESVEQFVKELPDFSFDGKSLTAPGDYARAIDVELDHALVEF